MDKKKHPFDKLRASSERNEVQSKSANYFIFQLLFAAQSKDRGISIIDVIVIIPKYRVNKEDSVFSEEEYRQ